MLLCLLEVYNNDIHIKGHINIKAVPRINRSDETTGVGEENIMTNWKFIYLFPSHIVANYGQQNIKTKSYLTLTSIYLRETPINKSSRRQFPLGSFLLYYIYFLLYFYSRAKYVQFFPHNKTRVKCIFSEAKVKRRHRYTISSFDNIYKSFSQD